MTTATIMCRHKNKTVKNRAFPDTSNDVQYIAALHQDVVCGVSHCPWAWMWSSHCYPTVLQSQKSTELTHLNCHHPAVNVFHYHEYNSAWTYQSNTEEETRLVCNIVKC